MKIRRVNYITWISVLLSLLTIGYFLRQLDWEAFYRILVNLHWGWVLAGWLIFMLNYLLRTLRFQILLQLKGAFGDLFSVTCLYGLFNYLLPAKSGEFSLLLLLKRFTNVSLPESTAILVAVRFFDFATIALFLPFVLFGFRHSLPLLMIYFSLVYCLLVLIVGIGGLWLLRRNEALSISVEESLATSNSLSRRVINLFKRLVQKLRLIDRRGQYWQLWLLTISIWLCIYTNFYCIVRAMGFELTYIQMILVSMIMVPMTLLPVQGVANLGTHELGWSAAFALMGQPADVSLLISFGSHVILLAFVSFLGGLGALALALRRT